MAVVEAGLARAVAKARRSVRCTDCGGDFELSASHVRHVREGGNALKEARA